MTLREARATSLKTYYFSGRTGNASVIFFNADVVSDAVDIVSYTAL